MDITCARDVQGRLTNLTHTRRPRRTAVPGPHSVSWLNQEGTRPLQRVLQEVPERDRLLLLRIFLEQRTIDEVCREFHVDREYPHFLVNKTKARFKAAYQAHRGIA